MAKKITKTVTARLQKNTEKAGSWLCSFTVINETGGAEVLNVQAWANASAGKRWVKSLVLETSGRKSIKMEILEQDVNGKPTLISGSFQFKVEE